MGPLCLLRFGLRARKIIIRSSSLSHRRHSLTSPGLHMALVCPSLCQSLGRKPSCPSLPTMGRAEKQGDCFLCVDEDRHHLSWHLLGWLWGSHGIKNVSLLFRCQRCCSHLIRCQQGFKGIPHGMGSMWWGEQGPRCHFPSSSLPPSFH